MITMHLEKSTRRLSPRVKVALSQNSQQQLPQAVGSFFNLVNTRSMKGLISSVLHAIEVLLLSIGAVSRLPEISRRRANQLRNFVRVLETRPQSILTTAYRVAKENFSCRFDHACFSGTGWPE